MKFSANLGFLWNDLPLPDAIKKAHQAGYTAVECHWPYMTPTKDVKQALAQTNMTMLGLNTNRGNVDAGENGLSALPGREREAQLAIDEALAYAHEIGTPNVHVMAGFAGGDAAKATFINNLQYAADKAEKLGITILIEPLNHYDAPGYFLQTSSQAIEIIRDVKRDNLKLMFDCYHLQIMEGDIARRIKTLLPYIGHIQFASVPDRQEPNTGELNYEYIFNKIKEYGYHAPLGAEYKPASGQVNNEWLKPYQ